MADKTYVDEDGNEFTAQLVPAVVVISRKCKKHQDIEGNFRMTEKGEHEEVDHAVGSIDAHVLSLPRDKQFSKEIVDAGAQRWAREIARELLGVDAAQIVSQ